MQPDLMSPACQRAQQNLASRGPFEGPLQVERATSQHLHLRLRLLATVLVGTGNAHLEPLGVGFILDDGRVCHPCIPLRVPKHYRQIGFFVLARLEHFARRARVRLGLGRQQDALSGEINLMAESHLVAFIAILDPVFRAGVPVVFDFVAGLVRGAAGPLGGVVAHVKGLAHRHVPLIAINLFQFALKAERLSSHIFSHALPSCVKLPSPM
mmetsp:Transcript_19204/g.36781  ORF Transcript_19204/g.36781 Transcript_19204/m.36781 type:complete len:211 (+) Transcript_19204:517-1149(+)